jgi:hypothetical protein
LLFENIPLQPIPGDVTLLESRFPYRDVVPEKRLLRLMADPNVRVVTIEGPEQHDVPPPERERF